jgi:hypothetical protein
MRISVIASALVLVCGLALSGPSFAQDDGGGSIGQPNGVSTPSNQVLLFHSPAGSCRDTFQGGVKLRNAPPAPAGGASGTINVPAHVASGAVYAQLFWVILDNTVPPNTETFNGNALTRVANGPVTLDPCWGTEFAYSWRADVLPYLQTGVNTLAGFPDDGVLGGAPNTEGATLVVVYNTLTVDKEIFVFGGNDLINGQIGQYDAVLTLPPIGPLGVGAELTYIVGDGQGIFDDEAYWNGIPLDAGDAFEGLDQGPGTTAGGGGYWDTLKFGVGIAAANTVSIDTSPFPAFDCLNWVGTVLATKRGGCQVPTAPSTWGQIKSRILSN